MMFLGYLMQKPMKRAMQDEETMPVVPETLNPMQRIRASEINL